MKSDSPVSSRLPAPMSAPRMPPCFCDPSPKIVSISMPSSMYIMPPASATVASFGIELDFDELHVVAEDLVVDFVHLCHACGPFECVRRPTSYFEPLAVSRPSTCSGRSDFVEGPDATDRGACLDLRHVMRYMSMPEVL